jgi:hypothetical protein
VFSVGPEAPWRLETHELRFPKEEYLQRSRLPWEISTPRGRISVLERGLWEIKQAIPAY